MNKSMLLFVILSLVQAVYGMDASRVRFDANIQNKKSTVLSKDGLILSKLPLKRGTNKPCNSFIESDDSSVSDTDSAKAVCDDVGVDFLDDFFRSTIISPSSRSSTVVPGYGSLSQLHTSLSMSSSDFNRSPKTPNVFWNQSSQESRSSSTTPVNSSSEMFVSISHENSPQVGLSQHVQSSMVIVPSPEKIDNDIPFDYSSDDSVEDRKHAMRTSRLVNSTLPLLAAINNGQPQNEPVLLANSPLMPVAYDHLRVLLDRDLGLAKRKLNQEEDELFSSSSNRIKSCRKGYVTSPRPVLRKSIIATQQSCIPNTFHNNENSSFKKKLIKKSLNK